MKIIKSCGIEFRESELDQLAQYGLYIVKYNTVYHATYSKNAGSRLEKVYKNIGNIPLTKRGRYHVMDYKQVNSLLGFELLIG